MKCRTVEHPLAPHIPDNMGPAVYQFNIVFVKSHVTKAEYSKLHILYTRPHQTFDFYSASTLLAMQSAVIVRGIPSIRPSVRPSVCLSRSGIVSRRMKIRSCPLVSEDVKFIRIFAGTTPSGIVKVRHPSIDSKNLTNNRP